MLLSLLQSALAGVRSRRDLLLEYVVLRHQLQVALRTNPTPRLRTRNRILTGAVISPHTYGMQERMRAVPGGTAERVTVSLPRDLFEWGEGERRRAHVSRSQFVADLYRRYRDGVEERERVARYAAAYGATPTTEAEDYVTRRSVELLYAEGEE